MISQINLRISFGCNAVHTSCGIPGKRLITEIEPYISFTETKPCSDIVPRHCRRPHVYDLQHWVRLLCPVAASHVLHFPRNLPNIARLTTQMKNKIKAVWLFYHRAFYFFF